MDRHDAWTGKSNAVLCRNGFSKSRDSSRSVDRQYGTGEGKDESTLSQAPFLNNVIVR